MPVRRTIAVHLRFEDLLKIHPNFYAKTWSSISVECPRFEDSYFENLSCRLAN
jgi:hypothetical protein